VADRPRASLAEITAWRLWRQLVGYRAAVVVVAAWGLALYVGRLAVLSPHVATRAALLAAAACLVVARPRWLALAVVPGVFLTRRVPGGSMSFSDGLLIAGCVVPFLVASWREPLFRRLFFIFAAYEVVLVTTVIAHPSGRAVVEWMHRFLLLGGTVAVGAYLTREGLARRALRLFVLVTGFVAAAAIVDTLTRGLGPAYPFGLHKNYVGAVTAAALLLSFAIPQELRLGRRVVPPMQVLLLGGLLASQSRGAEFGLVAGALVVVVLHRGLRWSRAVLVMGPLVFVLAALSVNAEFSASAHLDSSRARFESFQIRRTAGGEALQLWRESPLVGQGLRSYLDQNSQLQTSPHNIVYEALVESGIVGLAAFFLLQGGAVLVLRRAGSNLALAALALVVANLVHGLFDLYWVAGTLTLTWLVVGMAAGEAAHSSRSQSGPQLERLQAELS